MYYQYLKNFKKHLMITMYSVLWFLAENVSMGSCFEQLLALQLVTQFYKLWSVSEVESGWRE